MDERPLHGKGLLALGFGPDVDASSDAPFQQSLAKSSPTLLDPTANDGSPGTWKFGGPNNEADVLIILVWPIINDVTHDVVCSMIRHAASSSFSAAHSTFGSS